jgi:uncharacterized membrane protein YGL010W
VFRIFNRMLAGLFFLGGCFEAAASPESMHVEWKTAIVTALYHVVVGVVGVVVMDKVLPFCVIIVVHVVGAEHVQRACISIGSLGLFVVGRVVQFFVHQELSSK